MRKSFSENASDAAGEGQGSSAAALMRARPRMQLRQGLLCDWKLAQSHVGRPFSPICTGALAQPQAHAALIRLAAQSIDEDRNVCIPTLGNQRAGPFEMKRSRPGAGFAA